MDDRWIDADRLQCWRWLTSSRISINISFHITTQNKILLKNKIAFREVDSSRYCSTQCITRSTLHCKSIYIYIYIIIPSINQIKITTLMMIHYVDYWFWNVSVGEWWRIIECKHNLQRWWPSQMVLIITIITCFWNLWLISIIIFRMVIVRIIIFFFLKKHAIWYETLGTRTNDKTSIFLSSNSFIESIRLIWKSNEEDSKSLFIYFVSQMYFHLEYYFMKYLQR